MGEEGALASTDTDHNHDLQIKDQNQDLENKDHNQDLENKDHKQDLENKDHKQGLESKEEKEKAKLFGICVIMVVFLILFFGLFALITWLALRPMHSPKYSIDNVQITTFAMNNSTLAANFAFNVTATNENHKLDFKYDWITIDASYGGQNFGQGSIAAFKQGERTNTTRSAGFDVTNVTLPGETATSLEGAIRNGSVPIRCYAKAKIQVEIGKYVSFPVNVDVDCSLVVVPPSLNSIASVVSKVCRLTRPPYKKARKFKSYRPITYSHKD